MKVRRSEGEDKERRRISETAVRVVRDEGGRLGGEVWDERE